MIEKSRIAEILKGSDREILAEIALAVPELTLTDKFDLLELLEDNSLFKTRLPLRLEIYASIAQNSKDTKLQLIAYLRLLRRLGARKDTPDLGEIPVQTSDFAVHLCQKARELTDDGNLIDAVESLAMSTRAFRSGDLGIMNSVSEQGLSALDRIDSWRNPPDSPDLVSLAVGETGHELFFIATNAVFRTGDVERARELAEEWSDLISKWERSLGSLPRQRYQYYQMVGHLNYEVGLYEAAIEAYTMALEFAPTPYRKAFLWLSLARIERSLGQMDECWDHATAAIGAIIDSPYPQAASTWIEWLALDADTTFKQSELETLRKQLKDAGGEEINRVTRAMTRLYRLLASLRAGVDPSEISPVLDHLIDELEGLESWPNLVTILATRAVVSGRLNDRAGMDESIAKAREILDLKVAKNARPPMEFFLENAKALALRDIGDYNEAFSTLFEKALEVRMKYPGGMGPEERTTVEAIYYLGALSGYDPDTIEKKISRTLKEKVN